MIYVLTLNYIRPKEEIDAHLDTHRDWLQQHSGAGRILAAGPLESNGGGLVLAHCRDRAELDTMIAEDSFHKHGLVTFDVQAFSPKIRAEAFPSTWAPEAKAAVAGSGFGSDARY